jgi:hypothetical protein
MPRRPAPPLILLYLLAAGACERAPSEPRSPAAAPVSAPATPSLALAARRVAASTDGGAGSVFAVAAPAPVGTTVVGFTLRGNPAAALVDTQRAWLGRDGAERALALWAARAETPDAAGVARLVGALVYPGCAVLVGAERPAGAPSPALANHPGGGRVLTFAFAIPDGGEGAGLHVARWRYTDSGLLIEASPHPERR